MQTFARRGFQLRTASLETRITYTGFLLLMLPGVLTLIALSMGRVGFHPHALAAYYRGGETEMSFPKTFWQLTEVSHFHLFTVPVVALILSHLLYGTMVSTRVRVGLTLAVYLGAFLDALGPWAIRYLSGSFAYVLLLGWILLAGGMLAIVFFTLISMWTRSPQAAPSPVQEPSNGEGTP